MPKNLSKKRMSQYISLHSWIRRHYGKAKKCVKCKRKGLPKYEWANISGEYKRDISDYMELCQSCHRRKDNGLTCGSGHRWTKKTIYTDYRGQRVCRKCRVDVNRRYLSRKREKNGPIVNLKQLNNNSL